MEYAIVDIETSGGSPAGGGITEIAVLIHDGESIIHEYETLLNPGHAIPTHITGLTGIDNFMVRNSPRFDQILDELWGLLEGRVFVAHNVSFDFSFIREGFLKAGKDFKPEKLCTVKLSRKAFPNLTSYSLGRLCETQGIRIDARHRAMGDAKATAILFDRIIKKSPQLISSSLKKNSGEAFLPPHFSGTRFREIPESCGVYYMLDEKGKVIYVGKAINIKERFKNHFSGLALPELKQKLKTEVVDLKWQETGTEFLALLLESLEIKRLWPKYNAALKIPKTLWGLFHYQDGMGYGRLQLSKVTPYLKPLEIFFSSDEANSFLKMGIEQYQLCGRLSGLRKVNCTEIQDANCLGACYTAESSQDYNLRVEEFLTKISTSQRTLKITVPGKMESELAVCVFERGILTRYGFFPKEEEEKIKIEMIDQVPQVPETFYILRQFIHQFDQDQIQVLDKN
jgi:DNA polymerase-3 subunit epsilon